MRRKLFLLMTVCTIDIGLLAGCGSISTDASGSSSGSATVTEAPTDAPTEAPTEAPHEHAYTEAVTLEVTCTIDGEKTFTCECGDSYKEAITALGHAYVEDETTKVEATCEVDGKASDKKCSVCGDVVTGEVVTATGHIFEAYTSNNDATYTADGTETAKCNNCDVTDTRVAEGSMLTYSYTDMDATMYAQQTVNVRNLPSTDGEKLGGLSTNDEVKVTGQCTETSWYRIEYNGQVGYVSNNYLGTDKVVVQEETTTSTNANLEPCPYALNTWTKETSSIGCTIYRIYTVYSNYRDVVDMTHAGQTNRNIWGDNTATYEVWYEGAPSGANGWHTVFSTTEVGTYQEGTIYVTDWGSHFHDKGADGCATYGTDACKPGAFN